MIQADIVKLSHAVFRSACRKHLEQQAWKSIGQYERQLWSACLSFFRGDSDAFGFIDDFTSAIENQLTRAWNEGARSVDFDPLEMTERDHQYLQEIIDSEEDHVLDLAQAIEDAVTAGMSLQDFRAQFRSRIDLWVNRYSDTVNRAAIYFGGKKKLMWVLGKTEEHCSTCLALNGIVAYAEEWEQSGIKPGEAGSEILECGGWHCDCSLVPTDKRRTANALGRLLDIAVSSHL